MSTLRAMVRRCVPGATVRDMSSSLHRHRANLAVTLSALCAVASYLAALIGGHDLAAAWLMVLAVGVGVYGFMLFAGGDRWTRIGSSIAALCLIAGFAVGLLVPASAGAVLGVPLGTVLMGVLAGVVPLIVLPVTYALADHSAQPRDGTGTRPSGTPRS